MECPRCGGDLKLLYREIYGSGKGSIDLYRCDDCDCRFEIAKIIEEETIIKELE